MWRRVWGIGNGRVGMRIRLQQSGQGGLIEKGRLSHNLEEVRISPVFIWSESIQAEGIAKSRARVARVG